MVNITDDSLNRLYVCIYIYLIIYFIYSAEIAKHLNENSYGLIFGVNTFIALVLQSILTVIVVDERGLALDTRTQVSNVSCKNPFSRIPAMNYIKIN
jgi:hypothetical protein